MHLDEERVQRLLHGELAPSAEAAVREHLEGCTDCRARVAAAASAEREVFALLHRVDHPVPRIDAHGVVSKATTPARAGGPRMRDSRWMRRAAGIVLAFGAAGIAYAAPGSPLRGWVEAAVEWVEGGDQAAPAPAHGTQDRSAAGVAVDPGENFVIRFTSAQPQGVARVSLTDGREVVVRAPSGAAVFTSDVDQLIIDNRHSSASYEIQIPRAAVRVEIRVGSSRIFFKEGARTTAPRARRTTDRFILALDGTET